MKDKLFLIVITALLMINFSVRAEDVVSFSEQAYVEMWNNLSGGSVSSLTGAKKYLEQPDKSFFVDKLDIRPSASKYGIRVRGCITPKQTKEYTFWLSTDDAGELWLSSDQTPENIKKIAYLTSCSTISCWNKYASQKSTPVLLEAGKSYYFEALQKEHAGGDHLQVAWSYDGGSPEIIEGDVLGIFNANDTQPPQKPENLTVCTVSQNSKWLVWSSVTDDSAVFEYRVYKNGEYLSSTKSNLYLIESSDISGDYPIYTVCAVDLLGNESDMSEPISEADDLCKGGQEQVNGLLGFYYNTSDFFVPNMVRLDPNIAFSWSTGSPNPQINSDYFYVAWEGELEPRYSEEYTFYVYADDGVRLWINNELVIERWSYKSEELISKPVRLEAGKKYDIRIQYYEGSGGAFCKLRWSSNSQKKELIPSSQLFAKVLVNTSGVKNIWTGLAGNKQYTDPANWSRGVIPGENTEILFIPAYNNPCNITNDISLKSMNIYSGYDADINCDGHSIALTGDLIVDTANPSFSKNTIIKLTGKGEQEIGLNIKQKFHEIIVDKADGGSAIFTCSFKATDLVVTPGSRVKIFPSSSIYADKIDWRGTKENPINIGLSTSGSAWYLRLKKGGEQLVSYVNVACSNATNSDTIDGTAGCVDMGNNKNWIFSFASVVEVNDTAVDGAIQVEGLTQGGEIQDIVVLINGVEVPVAVDRGDVWYSDAQLVEGQDNKIEVLKDGEVVYTKVVAYTPENITGREITVRHRDGKLIKTSDGLSSSASIMVDMDSDGVYESNVFSSNVFALSFDEPGEYFLPAKIDLNHDGDFDDPDETAQTLKINSIEVNFNGPIACMLGYKRDKSDITIKGIDAKKIFVTTSNPAACEVSRLEQNSTDLLLTIHPIISDNHMLLARLDSPTGPIIEHIPLDTFSFKTSARNQMEIIKQFANTDVLVRGKMMMFPYVQNLDISMHIFVWGTTFEDSTIDSEYCTNDFAPLHDETMPFGTYGTEYKMIMTQERLYNHGPCHTIKIYQNGVVIGE